MSYLLKESNLGGAGMGSACLNSTDYTSAGMNSGGPKRGCGSRKEYNLDSRRTSRVQTAWGGGPAGMEDLKTGSLGGQGYRSHKWLG